MGPATDKHQAPTHQLNSRKGAETSILQNGFMSEFFLLNRGCRQGDPLSPYIFFLCAEVLGQLLRKNINIKGIVINNTEMKISQICS